MSQTAMTLDFHGRLGKILTLLGYIIKSLNSAVARSLSFLVRYSISTVESLAVNSSTFGGKARVDDLFGGSVIVVSNGTARADAAANDFVEGSVVYLLIKMHAGLWSLCVDLRG